LRALQTEEPQFSKGLLIWRNCE